MVKADAYGHGLLHISELVEEDIDYFGVATVNEGRLLRVNNINKPILVSVVNDDDIKDIIKYNLIPIIDDLNKIKLISKYALLFNKQVEFHLKIDTGMNRLGIKYKSRLNQIIKQSKKYKNITLTGICSHFYNSEDVKLQQKIFDEFAKDLNVIKHFANSGVYTIKELQYDMVRLGLGLYNCDFLTISTNIINIKHLKSNESSGYDKIFRATKDTSIAIINGGYYDGILRNMVGCDVIISDYRCKIIAVCMDTFIVDIKDYNISKDDKVLIVGSLGKNKITVNDIAKHCDTIPYEIMTNFKGNRMERIYYK